MNEAQPIGTPSNESHGEASGHVSDASVPAGARDDTDEQKLLL